MRIIFASMPLLALAATLSISASHRLDVATSKANDCGSLPETALIYRQMCKEGHDADINRARHTWAQYVNSSR